MGRQDDDRELASMTKAALEASLATLDTWNTGVRNSRGNRNHGRSRIRRKALGSE